MRPARPRSPKVIPIPAWAPDERVLLAVVSVGSGNGEMGPGVVVAAAGVDFGVATEAGVVDVVC